MHPVRYAGCAAHGQSACADYDVCADRAPGWCAPGRARHSKYSLVAVFGFASGGAKDPALLCNGMGYKFIIEAVREIHRSRPNIQSLHISRPW
jgi:hypothetical protein